MRNKLKITSFTLVLALILPIFAAAQTETETRQLREQARQRIDEAKTQDRGARVEALKKLAETQTNRTERAIRQLEELIHKIERALTALKDRGVDTSTLQASFTQAETLKSEAQRMLADLKAKRASIDPTGTEPKRQVQAFMTSMNNIKKKLIELHRALMNIVKEMRRLEQSVKNNSGANASQEDQ